MARSVIEQHIRQAEPCEKIRRLLLLQYEDLPVNIASCVLREYVTLGIACLCLRGSAEKHCIG